MILKVRYEDGTEGTVEVRKVGLVMLAKLLDERLGLDDKAKLAMVEPEQFQWLDADSQMAVYEAGMDLNEGNLQTYMERQKKQVKLMTGMDMSELLKGKVSELTSSPAGTV